MFKKLILMIPVLVVVTIAFPMSASAQQLSMSLSPPLVEVMIKPGKTITQEFRLTNHSEDSEISVQVVPFNQNGLISDNLSLTVSWIEIISPEENFILKKGESALVVLKISPPQDSKETDYYQAVVFNNSSKVPGRGSNSRLNGSLAGLLFINVTEQGLKKNGKITLFTLPEFVDSFSGLDLRVKVKNTGETYFHPVGDITLKGALGSSKFPLIPRTYLVGEEKELTLDSDSEKISGFFLGKYSIKVSFLLDEGNIRVEDEKTFYAFPFKLFGVLALIFIIMKLTRKKKAIIIIFMVLTSISISEPGDINAASIVQPKNQIKAGIAYNSMLTLTGHTSPGARVAAEGYRVYGETYASNTGLFMLKNVPITPEIKEICLSSTDTQNRSSSPLCLPVAPVSGQIKMDPVILPPTISLSHDFFHLGQKAYASGRSIPKSRISIHLSSTGNELRKYEVATDLNGTYNFQLPTEKSVAWNIFSGGIFEQMQLPKSRTLYYFVNNLRLFPFIVSLPYLLWISVIYLTACLMMIYERKTGNLSEFASFFQGGTAYLSEILLWPRVKKVRLKQKLLWYNLRVGLKLYQRKLFHKDLKQIAR